jgi:hypothetical protein
MAKKDAWKYTTGQKVAIGTAWTGAAIVAGMAVKAWWDKSNIPRPPPAGTAATTK